MLNSGSKIIKWEEVIDFAANIDGYDQDDDGDDEEDEDDDEEDGEDDDPEMKGRKRKGQGARLSPFRSLFAQTTQQHWCYFLHRQQHW